MEGQFILTLTLLVFYILTLTLLTGTSSPEFTNKEDEKFYIIPRWGQCSLSFIVEGQFILTLTLLVFIY